MSAVTDEPLARPISIGTGLYLSLIYANTNVFIKIMKIKEMSTAIELS